MKRKLILPLIIVFFLLSACGTAEEVPSPTATVEVISVETEAVVDVQPETDECLACHTDKQRLIDTAEPVLETEGESKGVG